MRIVHSSLDVRPLLILKVLAVLIASIGLSFVYADVASATCHTEAEQKSAQDKLKADIAAGTVRRGVKAADELCVIANDGTAKITSFLDTPIGRTLRNVAKIGGIALALWGVVKAASKGFGREGGGIGAFAKGLVVPMIAAAFLYNLQWAFTLLGWAISIVGDLFSLIGDAF